MLRLLIVAACASLAYAGLEIGSCGVGAPMATMVTIDGCDAVPCELVRGTDAFAYITFQAPFESASLRPRVLFTITGGSGEFPMPAEQQNACNHLVGSACPLSAGEDVTWKLTMPVLEEYPAEVKLILQMSLIGDYDKIVTCFEIDTVVV